MNVQITIIDKNYKDTHSRIPETEWNKLLLDLGLPETFGDDSEVEGLSDQDVSIFLDALLTLDMCKVNAGVAALVLTELQDALHQYADNPESICFVYVRKHPDAVAYVVQFTSTSTMTTFGDAILEEQHTAYTVHDKFVINDADGLTLNFLLARMSNYPTKQEPRALKLNQEFPCDEFVKNFHWNYWSDLLDRRTPCRLRMFYQCNLDLIWVIGVHENRRITFVLAPKDVYMLKCWIVNPSSVGRVYIFEPDLRYTTTHFHLVQREINRVRQITYDHTEQKMQIRWYDDTVSDAKFGDVAWE